jgi:ATP-dependent DNA helicase DinG
METADKPALLPSIGEFFAPEGILIRASGFKFEHRLGQYRMALFVEKALIEGTNLVVEAGTGTGKTLAYLFPALRYAIATGKRIIVSTGTKSLQEQIFYKDVPFLESIFGELNICYMKGRSNYLCRQKLYEAGSLSLTTEEHVELKIIHDWEKTTSTGDRAELAGVSEASTLWHRIDARTDACTGKSCPSYDSCFVTTIREKAVQSNLVIINHHLFFTDLTIRMKASEASILPVAHAVVFDEAHELEHVASDCFGLSVSNRRIGDLANDIIKVFAGTKSLMAVQLAASDLVKRLTMLWDALPGELKPERFSFTERAFFVNQNLEVYTGVLSSLKLLHSELARFELEDGISSLKQRMETVFAEFRYIFEFTDDKSVFWIERRLAGRGTSLNTHVQAAPIDVADALADNLFANYGSVIMTSATLAVQQNFQHLRKSLGITETAEMIVPSVFDYRNQAMLYLPPNMPEPRDPAYFERAKTVIEDLLRISQGRAFCLFTSYELMQRMYATLSKKLPYPLLLHGSMSRMSLLKTFRSTPNAVLFGTSSFWQGIDVQGEQLSCVIIDKLPFGVPTDPVVRARTKAIEAAGGNGFFDYQVPKAVIALNQGFGRLIRSMSDRGILAMLDPRIQHPRYGKIFLESMPPYQVTRNIRDLATFLESKKEAV